MTVFAKLWKAFSDLPEVTAIALGGSRSGETYDETSDYDLYIYCTSIPDENSRKSILTKYCSYMEMSNQFWELEDDCTLNNGVDIDILYRNICHFATDLENVIEKYQAENGYTTCFWHNLKTCKILYDADGELGKLQERFNVPFPPKLKDNIISRNFSLLTGHLPSYDTQILKAAKRKDFVSVNHRVTAFLESYFDIIFAVNELTHPGEKRMMSYAKAHASLLPNQFEKSLNALLMSITASPEILEKQLREIIVNLEGILS